MEIIRAATVAGLTPAGYVGDVALAVARGGTLGGKADQLAVTPGELATIQRQLFAARTAVNRDCVDFRVTWSFLDRTSILSKEDHVMADKLPEPTGG
ncbi:MULTISPECIES: hypothetical protein [Micromonospora]|uniref:hypothetical protein n=1 Tax=Micromonospora TaxID=1873 RepID=UPI0021C8508A|nr:hypothetical protein [Micromonospora sp. Mcm103]